MKKILTTLLLAAISFGAGAQHKGFEFSTELQATKGLGYVSNNYIAPGISAGYRFGFGLYIGVAGAFQTSNFLTYAKTTHTLDGTKVRDFERDNGCFFIPALGDIQYAFSMNQEHSQFVRLNVGYNFYIHDYKDSWYDKDGKSGMYTEVAYGWDFQTGRKSSVYVQLGPNFQYCKFKKLDITELASPNEDGYTATAVYREHNWMLPGLSLRVGYRF